MRIVSFSVSTFGSQECTTLREVFPIAMWAYFLAVLLAKVYDVRPRKVEAYDHEDINISYKQI